MAPCDAANNIPYNVVSNICQALREGKDVVFLFSDSQIKTEVFVEDINNILNAGEVPNMFPNDERMVAGPGCVAPHVTGCP
jgi:hypothetical protein